MPGYDNAFRVCYTFVFTNATVTPAASIRVPTHLGVREAAIEDIQFSPSVAVVNTTAPMQVNIGVAGTPAKYALQNVGTTAGLAIGSTYGVADLDGRVAAYNPQATSGLGSTNKGFIDLTTDGVTAGTLQTVLTVNTVIGTGTPAGTITTNIVMRWW
jgi:hypothetical protein